MRASTIPGLFINYLLYILKTGYKEFEEHLGQISSPKGAKTEMVHAVIRQQTSEFRLVDIERACPGVGRDWIRSLLVRLKEAGEVSCKGKGPGARWRYIKE